MLCCKDNRNMKYNPDPSGDPSLHPGGGLAVFNVNTTRRFESDRQVGSTLN